MLTYAALFGAVVFWGLSFIATKVALETIPTFTLVFARFSIASLFFLVLVVRNGFPRFTRHEHIKLFLTAFFEPGLYFVCETIGLQYTSAPKASLIIATIPLAVTLFAALLLGERARPEGLLGIFLSLLGICVLVTGDPSFSLEMGGPLIGDLLIVGAVISAALYMVIARNLGKRHSAMEITTIQIFYGALLFAPGFLYELPMTDWSAISTGSLVALAYLTLFATIAAFICYNYGLTQIPASHASIFINCIPVVTVIGAWLLLGETLTLVQASGGLLVLIAVLLPQLRVFRLRRMSAAAGK